MVSFTSKFHSVESLIEMLGMDISSFEPLFGVRGYKDRLYYDGININYGGDLHDTVWCEMSGQGCRAFETYGHGSWKSLFEEVLLDEQYHITRLDVAFDDHIGILDLKVLAENVQKKNFVSEFRTNGVIREWVGDLEAITVYHGSKRSDVFFRIYDKAMERNRENEGHWVRFEIQMRDNHARNFLDSLILKDIGDVFAKTVNKYIRYVKPGSDSNIRRWDIADFWYNFIQITEKLSLYSAPGVDYNFDNLERFVVDQAGAAAGTYIKLVGAEAFIEKCLQKYNCTNNPKYKELLSRYASSSIELLGNSIL